jgi:hypothetical protein
MSPIVQKVAAQLKKVSLSKEDRAGLINVLLEKLGAFPIGDMVIQTPNGLMVNGKSLDTEQQMAFREACVSLNENFARKVLNEQLRYKATEIGIHRSTTIDELMFSKAVLWVINEENILLDKLSSL